MAKNSRSVTRNGGGYAFSKEAHHSCRYGDHLSSLSVGLDLLNSENRVTDTDEAHELSDKVTRKLVEVAREGVIDLETLREQTLAAIMRQ